MQRDVRVPLRAVRRRVWRDHKRKLAEFAVDIVLQQLHVIELLMLYGVLQFAVLLVYVRQPVQLLQPEQRDGRVLFVA